MKITKEEEFFSDEGKYEVLGGFTVTFKLTDLKSLWDVVNIIHERLFLITLDYEDYNFKYKIFMYEDPDEFVVEYTRLPNEFERLAMTDEREELKNLLKPIPKSNE